MSLDKNNKKIKFFVAQTTDDLSKFLTITCKKEDAVDFCYKFLRIQNFNHFKMWCDLRNLKVDDDSAWDKYYNNCISIEEKKKYLVKEIIYKFNDVAAILRMFGGCLPVGCSFDTQTEYNYLNYKLEAQKATQNIADSLKNAFEKAQEELEDSIEE